MKVAVFSDIHGNYEALTSIYDDIKNNNIDEIIFLGDAIGLGPQPIKCLEFIMNHPDIKMVIGNHEARQMKESKVDYYAEGNRHHLWVHKQMKEKHVNFISKLPLYIERDYNGIKVYFSHFFLKSKNYSNLFYPFETIEDKDKIKEIKDNLHCDYMFVGHHHFYYDYKDLGIIDVSTSGCVYDDNTHYYILTIDKKLTYEKKNIKFDRNSFVNSFKDFDNEHNIAKRFFGVEL